MGVRLRWLGDGTGRFRWEDLAAFVKNAPPDSALYHAINGEAAVWTLDRQLQAATFDSLQMLLWQNSGGKTARPKPLPRPGVDGYNLTPDAHASHAVDVPAGDPFKDDQSGVFKGEPMPLDEMKAWLGWD